MKVIAYTALHYGRDYLGYSIQSVIDHVDEYYVLYSAVGSHGFGADVPCPESREELYWIAKQVAGDKLHWIDGKWAHEGYQRDSIHEHCPDADVIVVLDADEIWPKDTIEYMLAIADIDDTAREYRVPIIHYWRSFYRCVLHDPAYPIRLIVPDNPRGVATIPTESINHMGYAQRPEIVEYKQQTHGHRNEWRRDVDWYQDKFLANAQHDCHPVGSDHWNPEPVNPFDYMPDFMRQHPYADMEVIE